jgi:excisionase family DNA binding protein
MKSSNSHHSNTAERTEPKQNVEGDVRGNGTLLTAQEVAAELRCSKAQVYKLMNGEVKDRTTLPHIALGRKRVVRRSSFEAWKAANETATIPPNSEMEAVGAAN